MPSLSIVPFLAPLQAGSTPSTVARPSLALVREAEVVILAGAEVYLAKSELESFPWNEPTILIDVLEAVHEPREGLAFKILFDSKDVADITVPWKTFVILFTGI